VTRGAVADHAVSGVNRLVGGAAGKAADGKPDRGSDHPVGEILRQTFNRGTGDTGLVEHLGVAADDMRNRLATACQSLPLKRRGDACDVVIKAALRQQGACGQRRQNRTERQP
jgi:hypothetical protein